MQANSFEASIDFLYTQLPFFQRDGKEPGRKWNLEKTLALASYFGNPEKGMKFIHVGGTNGKGSVSHLIAGVLQQSGLKVGLYSSPHYVDFRERIKINGSWIDASFIIEFVEKVKPFLAENKPSFFELTFVMALCYFKKMNIDVAVIEVGVGGRLDSTNIIMPLLSVITNIGLDHKEFLGDSHTLIAREKAGIIKPKVPVVIGQKLPQTTPIFINKAAEQEAPLYFAEEKMIVESFETGLLGSKIKFQGISKRLDVDLGGPYQKSNLRTALVTLQELQKIDLFSNIDINTIRTAWSDLKNKTKFVGRWHLFSQKPTILGDSAHNTEGFEMVIPYLEDYTSLIFILGFSKEKELSPILSLLPKQAKYVACQAKLPRALSSTILTEKLKRHDLDCVDLETMEQAIQYSLKKADEDTLIYIGGSIFVVGEAMQWFSLNKKR